MSTTDERASLIRSRLSARAQELGGNLSARRQALASGLIRDLAAVLPAQREPAALQREQPRGAIPAARGTSQHNYQPGSSTGTGGIAGPLTEEDFSAREYYEPMLSSDGLFAIPQIKKMVLKDADGLEVVVELADPAAPAGGET